MDTPPVLVAELLAGCICDPDIGDYQLRVFCGVGSNVTAYVVDEETVPGDWDCTAIDCCDYLDGKTLRLTVNATGGYSALTGVYTEPVIGCNSSLTYAYNSTDELTYENSSIDFFHGMGGVLSIAAIATKGTLSVPSYYCARGVSQYNSSQRIISGSVVLSNASVYQFGPAECPDSGTVTVTWVYL
jgi:hypothetical protein